MIAIGLVRGISAIYRGTDDEIWATFWVQLETCISVIAASMAAFRTLFVVRFGSKKTPPDHYNKQPSRQRLWRKNNKMELPEVPTGATMTGIRTMIREHGKTQMPSFSFAKLTPSMEYQESGQGTAPGAELRSSDNRQASSEALV